MVENTNPINESAKVVRTLWDKHGINNPMKFLGFCLSLLPIPVIQQSGQILDRHLSDKDLETKLKSIWKEITELNDKVETIDTLEEAIAEIAKSVASNPELCTEAERISSMLGEKESIFILETDNNSYQELVSSIVEASRVHISATNSSTNVIEDTEVRSPKTHLHASGGSKNYINKTSFTDKDNSVGMDGISTEGDIIVTGNSVGFGENGALIFGGNPNLVSGDCPICNNKVEIDKRQLANYSSIQCPHCKNIIPFNIE